MAAAGRPAVLAPFRPLFRSHPARRETSLTWPLLVAASTLPGRHHRLRALASAPTYQYSIYPNQRPMLSLLECHPSVWQLVKHDERPSLVVEWYTDLPRRFEIHKASGNDDKMDRKWNEYWHVRGKNTSDSLWAISPHFCAPHHPTRPVVGALTRDLYSSVVDWCLQSDVVSKFGLQAPASFSKKSSSGMSFRSPSFRRKRPSRQSVAKR